VAFTGSYVAIVTPFNADGSAVDYAKLEELVEFQIQGGTDGIVPVGTTGESPTLSHDEHKKVVETVVKKVNKRVKVVAGAGSNSTAEALDLTKFAQSVGADGVLSVVPYYNKPTQEGLFQHFKAVAEVGLPVILYDIPGRSGTGLTVKTIARLAQVPNIVALKAAAGSMDQVSEIIATSPNLTILSGDDSLTLPMMSIGAKGVISVLANLVPAKVKALVGFANQNDYSNARKVHHELFALSRAMFIETNPIPVKAAMAMLGLCNNSLRLPMATIQDENKDIVKQALVKGKLLA